MGYKLLGYAVWHGGKWYLRRRLPGVSTRTVIVASAGGLMFVGGLAVAQRRAAN